MFIFGIITLIICMKLFVWLVSGAVRIAEHCSKAARVRSARRDIERNAANVQKQLEKVQEALDRPVQYKITVTGSDNGAGVPIENELRLSEKELLAQRRRIAAIEAEQRRIEKAARDKEKWEWEKEKMEWARRKEQDRPQELEWKRKQREQIEKERKEQQKTDKTEQARRIARVDLDFIDQSLSDLTPLVDQYRETFENTVTDKTKWNAYKKLYQLEARQNRLDKQRMKVLYTIQGGA